MLDSEQTWLYKGSLNDLKFRPQLGSGAVDKDGVANLEITMVHSMCLL